MKRILIYSEGALGIPDEGIRKFSQGLAEGLEDAGADVLLLSGPESRGRRGFFSRWGVNLHILTPSLGMRIRRFRPEFLLYIPTSSFTIPSLLRGILLSRWFREAPFGWIGLQQTGMPHWLHKISNLFHPILLVPSEKMIPQGYRGNGIQKIAGGVDPERFFPVTPKEKGNLRKKYGLKLESFILLHVGHLNSERNLNLLERIQKKGIGQVLFIGSSSTERDGGVTKGLKASGVHMIIDYIENIEEVYRLSDCYLFPVNSANASIEIPLSVLEAMATNLPVVTTRFGGLPDLFQEGGGFFYAGDEGEFVKKIGESRNIHSIKTREMVLPYSWKNVAKTILEALKHRSAPACRQAGIKQIL